MNKLKHWLRQYFSWLPFVRSVEEVEQRENYLAMLNRELNADVTFRKLDGSNEVKQVEPRQLYTDQPPHNKGCNCVNDNRFLSMSDRPVKTMKGKVCGIDTIGLDDHKERKRVYDDIMEEVSERLGINLSALGEDREPTAEDKKRWEKERKENTCEHCGTYLG